MTVALTIYVYFKGCEVCVVFVFRTSSVKEQNIMKYVAVVTEHFFRRLCALSLVPLLVLTTPSLMPGQLEPLLMNCLGWKTRSIPVMHVPSHP
jgi:hypothetical protein